jgi:hypothetical protein
MRVFYLLFAVFAVLALTSCDTVWDEPFTANNDSPDTEGFYTCSSGNFVLKYKTVPNNLLQCRMSTSTTGWIAVGFNPTQQMKDANYIIAYVSDGNGFIRDDFGTDNTAHVSDLSLGGSSDVALLAANESNGNTTVEFTLPLNSGDSFDRILQIGTTYPVIFATGSEDDFDSYHDRYAAGSIRIR